jgi:ABC-type antimicrobial peptide transport system permease subunit
MAVGAARGRVAGQVLREGLAMALWGAAFGLAGGFVAARLLRATLFGVSPADPWTYAAAAPLLAAVTTLASLLPALRAARMDPVRALRED